MASTDLSEQSGRRPVVQADIDNKNPMKALRIIGADVTLAYMSSGTAQSVTFLNGSMESFTFIVTALPSNPENCFVYPESGR